VIAGWLVKIVVVIALLGFAAVELGSPLWTRAQLDGIAHDAADEAARVYANSARDREQACAAAKEIAERDDASVVSCFTDPTANLVKLRVTVFKQAKSYVLQNFGPTKKWYAITISAEATSER
jgi:Flp pilus assembly protein TadG